MTTHDEATIVTIPVTLMWPEGEDFADMDVADPVIVSDTLEQIDIGCGLLGHVYLRFSGPDLVAAADAVRRLMDRVDDAVLDARQERLEAERHDCSCGTRLEPDELTCGAPVCEQRYLMDLAS